MELQQLLESIGLTMQEAKCYIALYSLKESKTGTLSNKSGIATANIYPVLESLIRKGLVGYKLVNNVKIFMPSSAESFNELIEKKQELLDDQKLKVQEAVSKLKQSGIEKEVPSDYKFFMGVSGIKSMWLEVLEYMRTIEKRSFLKIYGMSKESAENLRGFYNEFHKKRVRLGHGYRLITSKEDLEIAKLRKSQDSEVRMRDMKNEAAFAVFEGYFITYYSIGKVPVGFLIKDKRIAHTYDQMFEQLWHIKR